MLSPRRGSRAYQSCRGACFPRLWNPESPFGNQAWAIKGGIQFRIAFGEAGMTSQCQLRSAGVLLCQKPEALEHCAILDAFGVLDQLAVIAIRAFQVSI